MSNHLILVRNAIIKKTRNNKFSQGCGEKGSLCTVGGNVNWCSHYRKQCGGPSRLKIELPHDSAISLPSTYLKKMKTLTGNIYTPLCSLQHYLQQPRYRNKLKDHQWINGIFFSHKKGNLFICDNMDGPRRHYAN